MNVPILFLVLPLILAFASYGEVKNRRIPNWLTLGTIILGLGAATIEGGLPGLRDAAIGLAIGGGVFLPFCLLGVVGGGDMKLMAGVGAIVGFPLILRVMTDVCIAGGILAVVIMAWNGIFFTTLASAFKILVGSPRRQPGLKNPPMVPYGLAIAVGTIWTIFVEGITV